MADACSICGSAVIARGWCSKHYHRWKRTGDPLTTRTDLKPERFCSVVGCERDFYGRGFCNLHYTRWRKRGDPRYEPFLPTVCQVDGCDKPTGINAASLGLCRMHYRRYRTWGDPYFEYSKRGRNICIEDGCHEFVTGHGLCRQHYQRWHRATYPDQYMDKIHRRRARKLAAFVEPVSIEALAERDGWVCGICEQVIDPKLRHPHLNSRSLDHIVPLAAGGEHSMRNSQLAHLICNVRKGARVEEVAS